ncbi:PREDICTED: uncharacterized protein LOC104592192 isoform X2 [Nelumbo nucifera]|nr:PREDICTED: uncharacterized protein LOC104592192 isoform X2 [Nelumbo nucifera]
MRYNIFQNVCVQHQIGVLLIAHHADDQAELFILRLSRNSGVLGLAGMAFTSQLFSAYTHCDESSTNHGILLVRPLLEFSKEDMYKICLRSNQEWVEDPTNRSPLFARNRIRMSLGNLSCTIRSELQKLISTCRKTRSFVDTICNGLIDRAVTITTHGYAIIDLEKLNPSNIEDICLSKFASLVLQFISQRHRPVRSRTSQLLLDYIRKFPCKTSLTAAGCYLCAAPGSKGSNIIVCCSLDSPHPSKMETSWTSFSEGMKYCPQTDMQQIIMDGKSYSNSLLPGATEVPFLDVTPSGSLLNEAKNLGILSELTHKSILLLQKEENENFKTKNEIMFEHDFRHEIKSASAFLREPLQSGKICHFMSRFLVTWRLCRESIEDTFPLEETCCTWNSEGASGDYLCRSCIVSHETVAEVRPMVDSDWLYLANLSKSQIRESQHFQSGDMMNQREMNSCIDYVRLSAQRALQSLKSIPVAARRSLPVLVNPQGLLLSIPSICFKHCPYLMVSSVFKPRVPLGGHSSFI